MCSRVPSFKGFSFSGLAGWPVWGFPRNGDQGSQGSDVGPGPLKALRWHLALSCPRILLRS